MKANKILLVLFSILFVVYFVNASETLRGVNPKVSNNYKQDPFICDNTKKIPLSRVNDDYCDCKDGTDEPGTNACNNGQFWCRNDDWVGNSILGSHVNDGICDCCDGSDEWQGKVVCKNTCVEKRAEETKRRKELQEKGKRGLLKRDAYKESAKIIYENKRQELEDTQKRMGELSKSVEELEQRKSELEAKETIALEIKSLTERDLSQPVEEKKKEGDNTDDGGPDDVEAAPRMTEDERQNKLAELRKSLGQDDHEQVIQDMNELKIKISQERSEESNLRNKETTLIEFFALDFGPDNVFVELYDRCFNHQTKEYNYQICFYKKVDQGGTVIGNWKDWKNKYTVMTYEGGASCWNGPTRQTTVYLVCGETENFTNVGEPSKCIYEATFETPAACVPEEIESIQVEDIQF